MAQFEGIWLPLITPFRGGEVDLAAAARLAAHFVGQGVHGLIVCGTTGEAATLSREEQTGLLAAVIQAAGARCPVAMGVSGNDTRRVAETARHFAQLQPAALLVTAPYYTRPSQEGIRRHFEAVAAATARPIMLYNIPYRTGVNIEVATVAALARNPQFVAIKESGGNLNQLIDLLRETPLRVLCGEDHLIFAACALGAHGAVAAAAHVRPELFVAMVERLRAGRIDEARRLHNDLLPMVRALFAEPNPAPIKALLAAQGWVENELRLPMTRASEACRATLMALLEPLQSAPA